MDGRKKGVCVSERKKYTVAITDEDGHEHIAATMDTSQKPTPEVLALMLVRASMALDPNAVETAVLSRNVRRYA